MTIQLIIEEFYSMFFEKVALSQGKLKDRIANWDD